MSETMYGSGGDQAAQTVRPTVAGYGTLNGPVAARDVGALGMAANRIRSVNRSIDQAITSLRLTQERISETGSAKTVGSPSIDPPPPSQTIPGLIREIEAAESLVQSLLEAIRFTDSL